MVKKVLKIFFLVLGLGLVVAWFVIAPIYRNAVLLELERPFWHYFRLWESNRIEELPDSISVAMGVANGADWIVNMQEESGRFNYWYNVGTQSFSGPGEDNFLRQSGTAYALLLAYQAVDSVKYLEAARKSLDYQLKFMKELDEGKAYFLFRGKAKLGGTALPMLTMLTLRKLENDTTRDDSIIKLAKMIVYLQELYGTGQFKSTYIYRGDHNYEKTSGWESTIYPGEGMLALALMYQQFPDEKYKDAFDRAVSFYHSDQYNWEKGPFIPWTVAACVEMYEAVQEQTYVDFAFDMMEADFYWQNMNPKRMGAGAQYGYPTVFASTSQEALGDAIRLAKKLGMEEKLDEYEYRAKLAYRWLLSLQYSGEDSFGKGGFITSPIDEEIRIDNTQHAISAMTKGLWWVY